MKKYLLSLICCSFLSITISIGQFGIDNCSFENITENQCENSFPFFLGYLGDNWYSGSGRPFIVCGEDAYDGDNYAKLYARHNEANQSIPQGSSIFYEQYFAAGQEYTLQFAWRNEAPLFGNTAVNPRFNIKLTNGLQNTSGFQNDNYPFDLECISDESYCIFSEEIFDNATDWVLETVSFTPDENYTQLLIYPAFEPDLPLKNRQFVHVDSVCLSGPCGTDPAFEDPFFCRVGDLLELSLEAEVTNSYHTWQVVLVPEDQECTPNSSGQVIHTHVSGYDNNAVFTLPEPYTFEDIAGRCLVIKHYTTTPFCDAVSQAKQGTIVPSIPKVDPNFDVNVQMNGILGYYTYTPLPHSFPTNHEWSIERGNSMNGPWQPYELISMHNPPVLNATQPLNRWFKVCHSISSATLEFCSRDSICYLIFNDEVTVITDDETGGGNNPNGELGGSLVQSNAPINSIKTSPSPASTEINYTIQDSNFIEWASTIELINMNGQTLLQETNPPFTTDGSLDISHLPNGIYIMQLTNQNGQIKVQKVLITR